MGTNKITVVTSVFDLAYMLFKPVKAVHTHVLTAKGLTTGWVVVT